MLRRRGRNDGSNIGAGASASPVQADIASSSPAVESNSYHAVVGEDASSSRWLENIVLGGEREFLNNLDNRIKAEDPVDEVDGGSEGSSVPATNSNQKELKPAWEDEDDKLLIDAPRKRKLADIVAAIEQQDGKLDAGAYVDRLKKRFDKTTTVTVSGLAAPSWADMSRDQRRRKKRSSDTESESDDGDDEDYISDLTKRTGCYVDADAYLSKGVLQFKKMRDATSGYRIKAIVNSVEFHKSAQVLLVSGYTQRIQIYQIDGKENPMLQSVTLEGFPVETAHFSSDGEKVYAGSRLHEYFYYYDLLGGKVVKVPQIRSLNNMRMAKFVVSPDGNLLAFCGPYGNIHLLSAKTYECIGTMKMNAPANGVAFSSNGSAMYSHGHEGEVYVWDVRNRVCTHRFFDDGCVQGTCLAASSNDRYLATGSNTGVVNLYEIDAIRNSSTPKPIKAIMNLTTSVRALRFNPESEILSLASDVKPKHIRLFHTRSLTTFENFPAFHESMVNVQCVDFSLNSGYMCVACTDGRACLYRLLHYPHY